MTYKFKADGVQFKRIDPQVAGEFLDKLRVANGGKLRARDVIDAARHEECVLHECFEWEDSIAADRWRLHQARNLIKSVLVVVEPHTPAMPANVTVRVNGEQYYQSTSVLVSSPDELASAIAETRARLAGVQESLDRLLSLKSLAPAASSKLVKASGMVSEATKIVDSVVRPDSMFTCAQCDRTWPLEEQSSKHPGLCWACAPTTKQQHVGETAVQRH